MAAANDSRLRRGIARRGGNLPRTHPTPKARQKPADPQKLSPFPLTQPDERESRVESLLEAARAEEPARRSAFAGPPSVPIVLRDIRQRLSVVQSVAYTAAAALRSQQADVDADVAETLRRCIGDEVQRQLQRLDGVIAGGASCTC